MGELLPVVSGQLELSLQFIQLEVSWAYPFDRRGVGNYNSYDRNDKQRNLVLNDIFCYSEICLYLLDVSAVVTRFSSVWPWCFSFSPFRN